MDFDPGRAPFDSTCMSLFFIFDTLDATRISSRKFLLRKASVLVVIATGHLVACSSDAPTDAARDTPPPDDLAEASVSDASTDATQLGVETSSASPETGTTLDVRTTDAQA